MHTNFIGGFLVFLEFEVEGKGKWLFRWRFFVYLSSGRQVENLPDGGNDRLKTCFTREGTG